MEIKQSETVMAKQTELQDYLTHTVLITAGAALLMGLPCLKRVVLIVFLMEQWRAWVFLLLNLLLLAIFFTSISSTTSSHTSNIVEDSKNGNKCEQVVEIVEGKKNKRWPPAQDFEEVRECELLLLPAGGGNKEEENTEEEVGTLSKEALNERAEAFIVMFRQHLVSDARN